MVIILWSLIQPLVILGLNRLFSLPSSLTFESIVLLWSVGGIISLILAFFGFLIIRKVYSKFYPKTTPNVAEMRLRRKLDPLAGKLDVAKEEYWSLAITQHTASRSLIPTIVKMVEAGKIFKFLIINSEPSPGEPTFFKDSEGKILHKFIDSDPKKNLQRMRDGIVTRLKDKKTLTDAEISKRFQVREYNLPITHTLIIIDPNSKASKGWAQLEVFHYVPIEGDQLVFKVEEAKHPDEFAILKQDFENAWNHESTHPVDWDKL